MKLVTAIIRPERLDDAMTAVTDAGAGGSRCDDGRCNASCSPRRNEEAHRYQVGLTSRSAPG
jgi:hypothetical protein